MSDSIYTKAEGITGALDAYEWTNLAKAADLFRKELGSVPENDRAKLIDLVNKRDEKGKDIDLQISKSFNENQVVAYLDMPRWLRDSVNVQHLYEVVAYGSVNSDGSITWRADTPKDQEERKLRQMGISVR